MDACISALRSSWVPRFALILLLVGPIVMVWLCLEDTWLKVFGTLFTLRYARLGGHLMASFYYRPAPVQPEPRYGCRSVSVIIPTVDPKGPDFLECVRSVLANRPQEVFVVTVGRELLQECREVLAELRQTAIGHTALRVSAIAAPNKRRQIAHAMNRVGGAITILVDDHVIWPGVGFLPAMVAPFENGKVGVVAVKKVVRRTTPGKWSWDSIINFLACNYLQRHNWEVRASNAMDGGAFVVSGRTAAYRSSFLKDTELMEHFCNEKFFFGLFGHGQGLGPDDDNFLTRNAIAKNWLIKWQESDEAYIETSLGEWPKFRGQLLRWARTTFRSNPVMLRSPKFLWRNTWSYFMVYWAGITNFALLWDAALMTSLCLHKGVCWSEIALFGLWMIWTKTVKLIPHFLRYPSDFPLMIVQILFGYVHSLIKFWALVTFWNCDWSGRNLDEVNADGGPPLHDNISDWYPLS